MFVVMVRHAGATPNLYALVKEACWVVANLSAGPSEHRNAVLHAGLLPRLVELMSTNHSFDIQVSVCAALWTLEDIYFCRND
jgi:hypothetical protein